MPNTPNILKVGILNLTGKGELNNPILQSITNSLEELAAASGFLAQYDILDLYESRIAPELDYNFYIASDGYGNPMRKTGEAWEQRFFSFIDCVWNHNQNYTDNPKFIFYSGYAFQLMCHFFQIGQIEERFASETSKGLIQVSKTWAAKKDFCFNHISENFLVEDQSKWAVRKPDLNLLAFLEAQITSVRYLENDLGNEEELNSVRIGDYMMGMQGSPVVMFKQKSLEGSAATVKADLMQMFLKEAAFQLQKASSLVA